MANENQIQEVGYLPFDIEDIKIFAYADYELKSGKHIQNIEEQAEIYNFIRRYERDLIRFYSDFYNVNLRFYGSDISNDLFYFIEFDDETQSILKKSGNTKKIKKEHALLGIFLLKMDRIDKYFKTDYISVEELLSILKTNDDYKDNVNRLFAKTKSKDTEEIGENTINSWVSDTLTEFEKLGFVRFANKDKQNFEILPSIKRFELLYSFEIQNIDKLAQETPELTESQQEE